MKRSNRKMPKYKMIRPDIKVFKLNWEFHLTDVDPWPSIPHGHSLDSKRPLKLDIDTGLIYDVLTRDVCGKAKETELERLLMDNKFSAFLIRAREIHKSRHLHNIRYVTRRGHKRIVFRTALLCTSI